MILREKMNKYTINILLILTFLLIVSCSGSDNKYVNKEFGFELALPQGWSKEIIKEEKDMFINLHKKTYSKVDDKIIIMLNYARNWEEGTSLEVLNLSTSTRRKLTEGIGDTISFTNPYIEKRGGKSWATIKYTLSSQHDHIPDEFAISYGIVVKKGCFLLVTALVGTPTQGEVELALYEIIDSLVVYAEKPYSDSGNKYVNKEFGFEILVPEGWEKGKYWELPGEEMKNLAISMGAKNIIFPKGVIDFTKGYSCIQVSVGPFPTSLSFLEHEKETWYFQKKAAKKHKDEEELSSIEPYLFQRNGRTWCAARSTTRQGSRVTSVMHYSTTFDNQRLAIVLATPTDSADGGEIELDFYEIIDSLIVYSENH